MKKEKRNEKNFFNYAILTILASLAILLITFTLALLYNLRKPETVTVPNVLNNNLAQALIKLQDKELVPHIQLRFSDSSEERGKVIEQNPKGSSRVLIYHKVNLIISKGSLNDKLKNYIGLPLKTLEDDLNTKVISIKNRNYIKSTKPVGTILQQYPAPGTQIGQNVELTLWISKGDKIIKSKASSYIGKDYQDVINRLAKENKPFTIRLDNSQRNPGIITYQDPAPNKVVEEQTSYKLKMSMPRISDSNLVFNIFTAKLPHYEVPVLISLETTADRSNPIIFETYSQGDEITIPYLVSHNSTLKLMVNKSLIKEQVIN